MFDTILFDLDGTISDSGLGITRSVAYALEKFGIHVADLKTLNTFVGPPLNESFREQFGFSPEECRQAVAYYRERYQDIGVRETESYPGIRELLRKLKGAGKTVALATSKPTVFARVILDEYGVTDCFDLILGCELDGRRSEKIEVMEACLSTLDIDSDEKKKHTVMVGDRHYDIDGAKHCGIVSVGVTYGYAQGDELSGADYIVETTEALGRVLLS
ncbi:MAG: HAD hydrolase-like protein [Oscillospiraceae bacterium]